jgi:6-phosphofructokinase
VMLVCNGTQPTQEKAQKYAELLSPESPAELSQTVEHGKAELHRRVQLSQELLSGYGLVGSGIIAAQLMAHITGEEVFLQSLTYLLRTGSPDGQDLLGAANFALTASRLLEDGKYGRMTAFIQNKMWTDVDLKLATEGIKSVDLETWYDAQYYKPKLELIWSLD